MLTCDLTTLAPDIAGIETLCADRPFERSCKIHQDIFWAMPLYGIRVK